MPELTVAVIAGDGIGPEITPLCLDLLSYVSGAGAGFSLSFDHLEVGAAHYERTGVALPQRAIDAAGKADAILLAALGDPAIRYPDGTEITPQLDLREHFGLHVGVRPLRAIPGASIPLADPRAKALDAVLIRESTEGLFAARGRTVREADAVYDTMRVSRGISEALFDFAFRHARERAAARGRRARVSCIDKANVIASFAFFRSIFLEVAKRYPDVDADCVYVDAAALRLVRSPWEFDVMVTENMFGDILSDLGAGLIGGMGMAPSADIGADHAVFQPCHGSAPDIVGKGLANPAAMFLSGAMMLEWLGERHGIQGCVDAGRRVRSAVDAAFAAGDLISTEVGGKAGMSEIADKVFAALRRAETVDR